MDRRKTDDIFFTIYHDGTGSNKTNITTSTVNISDDKWHHVVGTWDGTTNADSMKVYFDGVEVAQATPSSTGINTEASAPWIGNSTNQAAGYNNWTGELSNIAVYNTGLDSSAVTALYNNGTPETSISSSPVSWWKLNNLTTGIQDSVGSNDGTNNGATKVDTFVSTQAATSSGMTEQNLVNNNVSVLNGESSGMTSANLVLSDLTRAVPYDSYSFNFDSASSDSVNLPNGLETILQSLTVGSISMWWNPVDATPSSGNALFTVASTTVTNDYFAMYNITDGKFYAQLKDNNSNNWILQTDAAAFSDNTWHHIVITQNGTEPELYVNGSKPAQTFTTSTNKTKWWDDITIEQVNIGALIWSGGTSGNIDGKISNCAIFNQALTSTEVMKLYANGVPQDLTSFTPAPVAWYPLGSNSFWNGSQWTVRDMIGSNDGTGQNIGVDGLVGDAPRSEANGTGTNMDVPSNLEGSTKWSENNSWSINMSETARVEDTP